jgi:GxxExxY protein
MEILNKVSKTKEIYSKEFVLKDETYAIIGSAMEVHKNLGCGFLEPVYQEALAYEFSLQKIPFTQQQELKIHYKDHFLKKSYLADFVLFGKISVEIKAEEHLSSLDEAQVINYLNASDYELGLLFNFGARQLEWKRIINSNRSKKEKV